MAASISSFRAAEERRGWVSPEAQLKRLIAPYIREQLETVRGQFSDEIPIEQLVDSLARTSIQRWGSPGVPKRILCSKIDKDAMEFFPNPLFPRSLLTWYALLKSSGALPKLVPPLPGDIIETLNTPCPIFGGGKKYRDAWSLALKIPGTVCQIEQAARNFATTLLDEWGEQRYPYNRNPFRFRFCHNQVRDGCADSPLDSQTYWFLHTNGVVPESMGQSVSIQEERIEMLNQEYGDVFDVPYASETLLSCFGGRYVEKIYFYPRHEQTVFTRLKKIDGMAEIVLGSHDSLGVMVSINDEHYCHPSRLGFSLIRRL